MKVTETPLPGVLLLTPARYCDPRGMFMETYNERVMGEHGLPTHWCQDNYSLSKLNVVRGLHYQVAQPQAKIVRVLVGTAFDVAVDLRRSSPHFGRHFAVELCAEEATMLYIPAGFAHGFAALTDQLQFAYKVDSYYSAPAERTILWNDPDLGIAWPIPEAQATLSDKDRQGARFRDAEVFA
jgi:dTDP-4-dehydrorhamnose 3,5-epimerase